MAAGKGVLNIEAGKHHVTGKILKEMLERIWASEGIALIVLRESFRSSSAKWAQTPKEILGTSSKVVEEIL